MLTLFDSFLENSYLYFYGATLLIALFRYSKYFESPLKYFPILLMYTFLNELLGSIIEINPEFNPLISGFYSSLSMVFYNIYNIIFIIYFLYIFWIFLKIEYHKKIVTILGIIFVVVSLVNPFFQNFVLKAQIYTLSLGGIILLYCILLYFKETNKIIRNKFTNQSLLFWISIGLFIFFIGYIPIKIYYSFSKFQNMELFNTIRRLHLSLVYIMYSFIIYGFIQTKGKLKV